MDKTTKAKALVPAGRHKPAIARKTMTPVIATAMRFALRPRA